jgi:hypothetical protein
VAAEAKETAEIKKEKLEAEIAEKKEAIKEGIAGQLPTPPAKPPVVGKPEGPGTGTGKK